MNLGWFRFFLKLAPRCRKTEQFGGSTHFCLARRGHAGGCTWNAYRTYQHVGIGPEMMGDGGGGKALLLVGPGGCGSKTAPAQRKWREDMFRYDPSEYLFCAGCRTLAQAREFMWAGTDEIVQPWAAPL